eukprot:5756897-Pyramimonas_sp.AAC.1
MARCHPLYLEGSRGGRGAAEGLRGERLRPRHPMRNAARPCAAQRDRAAKHIHYHCSWPDPSWAQDWRICALGQAKEANADPGPRKGLSNK